MTDVVLIGLASFQQCDQRFEVFALDGVIHRFVDDPGLFEPRRSTQVQRLPVGIRCNQALLEKLGEQWVQAIPRVLALHVHGHDKQVARLDVGDQRCRLARLADLGGHLHIEATQDRDLLQERHGRCRQVADHVFDQVIHKAGLARQHAIAV
ncbi:hypothetical protein D3C81_1000670 [compost metagenome]